MSLDTQACHVLERIIIGVRASSSSSTTHFSKSKLLCCCCCHRYCGHIIAATLPICISSFQLWKSWLSDMTLALLLLFHNPEVRGVRLFHPVHSHERVLRLDRNCERSALIPRPLHCATMEDETHRAAWPLVETSSRVTLTIACRR